MKGIALRSRPLCDGGCNVRVGGASRTPRRLTATTCDRECLRAKVTQLLYALLKHDVSGLPVAETLRVTEDAVEKPLAKVGLVSTVTRLRGFRQDIIDERAGVAGAHVVVEESWVARAAGGAAEGCRRQTHRNRAGGHTQPGRRAYLQHRWPERGQRSDERRARPEQLATRDAAIKAALHYPEGLNAAKKTIS